MAFDFSQVTNLLEFAKGIDLSTLAGTAKEQADWIRKKTKERDVRALWDMLSALPGASGTRVFDAVSKLIVPHAARMGFHVIRLDDTSMTVTMPDKRGNRNHLDSIHAMALAHLGEYTTGALTLYAVSPGHRTILTRYAIEYVAKARGTITARARFTRPKGDLDGKQVTVPAELVDRSGRVVARAEATWKIGSQHPSRPSRPSGGTAKASSKKRKKRS